MGEGSVPQKLQNAYFLHNDEHPVGFTLPPEPYVL